MPSLCRVFILSSLFCAVLADFAHGASRDAKLRKEEAAAFLEANGAREGVITTRSGLQYEIIVRGDSELRPKGKDTVTIHYHGTLIDGRVFESSVENGSPITMQLWDAIDGWEEGVKLMAIGDTFRFYIPSKLAYGSTAKATIPAHSALIFEIQLLAIKRKY